MQDKPTPFSAAPDGANSLSASAPEQTPSLAPATDLGATAAAPTNLGDVANAPAGAVVEEPVSEVDALRGAMQSGANWFFWIVGLSFINTLLISFNSDTTLAIGANATLVVDAMAQGFITEEGGSPLMWRGLQFGGDALILGFYVLCGIMAARGKAWAFWLGGIAFALDSILSLVMQEWIGVAVHAWALLAIWGGLSALKKLRVLERAQNAEPSPFAAA